MRVSQVAGRIRPGCLRHDNAPVRLVPKSAFGKVLFAGFGIILAAGAIYASNVAFTLYRANQNVTRIDNAFPEESGRPIARTNIGQNILLLGVDTRYSIAHDVQKVTGTRADSIMLVHINQAQDKIVIMSVMRDSWVPIPGIGFNKVNAALSLGGTKTMVATIEQLLDTRIDHIAMIDFKGLRNVVDQVGGITLNNPVAFTSTLDSTMYFAQGEIELDGAQALAFARERHALSRSDYQRVENQRAVLMAIVAKVLGSGVAKNPLAASQLFETLAPNLAMDAGIDVSYLLGIASAMGSADSNPIRTFTLQIGGSGWSDDGQAVVYIDQQKLQQVREHLAKDTLYGYRKS